MPQTAVARAFLLSLLLVVSPLAATANETAFGRIAQEALDTFLATEGIDGGVLAIRDGETDMVLASGIAERSTQRPVTALTSFYAASAGKMVVAAAILAYVEDGILDLDASVWPLISDLPDITQLANADVVTLRQLLDHTSGLPDYLDDAFFEDSLDDPTKVFTPADALHYVYGIDPDFPPDEGFEYSNTNYVLLGHILEKVAGSLEAALETKVFAKAGMRQTSVGRPTDTSVAAHGYSAGLDMSALAWASALADGPLTMTAGDLAQFLDTLFVRKSILGPESLRDMTSGSGQEETYGLGMGLEEDAFGPWYGHSGGYDGFESDTRHYPQTGTTLVIMMNGNQQSEETFLDKIAADYFIAQ